MRFHELIDPDGTVLARGLHPAIAVVSAGAPARATVISATLANDGCRILYASDVDEVLDNGARAAAEQREAEVRHKTAMVAEAERALADATAAAAYAAHDRTLATADLNRFDELMARLNAAQDSYHNSVQSEAGAARALADALGGLERIFEQRSTANVSVEEACKSHGSASVPEAVLQQASNIQSALAEAGTSNLKAVREAYAACQSARDASDVSLASLEAAYSALKASMTLMAKGGPNWGPGPPLPALAANFRDQLAQAATSAQSAEVRARSAERTATSQLESERSNLEALSSAEPPVIDPLATLTTWIKGTDFTGCDAVLADDAFSGLGPDAATALLSTLAAQGCQAVYLTEDPRVLGWAIALPREVGAASTITGLRARAPAMAGT